MSSWLHSLEPCFDSFVFKLWTVKSPRKVGINLWRLLFPCRCYEINNHPNKQKKIPHISGSNSEEIVYNLEHNPKLYVKNISFHFLRERAILKKLLGMKLAFIQVTSWSLCYGSHFLSGGTFNFIYSVKPLGKRYWTVMQPSLLTHSNV